MKKTFKKVSLLTAALVAAVSLASCSGTSSGDRLDAIKKAGVLRVGTETTYPPMEFTDDTGKAIGFDIEMMQYIADQMGVKMEIVSGEFAGLIEGLSANRSDAVAATMNITEDRKKSVLFSEPYIEAVGLSIIVNPDSNITSFADLAGKNLGIQQGSTTEGYVATRQDLGTINRYMRVTEALLDLSAKRVEAVVTDNVVGAYYMKQDPSNYKMLDVLQDAGPIGIAMPINSPKLKAEVDRILADMMASGKMSELSMKWFGIDIYAK